MTTSSPRIRIATLGLFILDTFEWHDSTTGEITSKSTEVIGGAGTYVCVAARMWLAAHEVGIVVDRGSDWPKEVQDKLDKFGEMWTFRNNQDQLTTRALNLYKGEHRGESTDSSSAEEAYTLFKGPFLAQIPLITAKPPTDFQYLTPRRRLEPIDLPPSLRRSTHLHFVCSPSRALVIHSQLLPPLNATSTWSPSLVYEPIPDRCCPAELEALRQVLPVLKVFSPNHEEAWAFFGVGVEEVESRGKEGVEEVARRYFEEGAADVVLIRSGAWGAYAVRKGEEKGTWVPAYYQYGNDKVVDVTGAGNSFLVS